MPTPHEVCSVYLDDQSTCKWFTTDIRVASTPIAPAPVVRHGYSLSELNIHVARGEDHENVPEQGRVGFAKRTSSVYLKNKGGGASSAPTRI